MENLEAEDFPATGAGAGMAEEEQMAWLSEAVNPYNALTPYSANSLLLAI